MIILKFEKVYEQYKIYARTRHKKQGFYTLTKDFKNHILPYFKDRNIYDLNTVDIIEWQTEILSKNFSNNFNRNLFYTFSSFAEYCVNYSYFSENIVLKVGNFRKRIEEKGHNVYTLFQFFKFFFNLDTFIYQCFFAFMYFYGTRPGETMALRLSDLYGKFAYIRHNIERRGSRELDTPKNQSSIRYIKLGFVMRFMLFILKCYYEKNYGGVFDYFIFGGIKPLSPTSIDRHKKRACQKANLFEITQHEFRHSYATRKIHKKVPVDVVSKSLGHSKISMTVDVYLHTEKRVPNTLNSLRFNFFNTLTKDFKKISQSIITFFIWCE